MDSPVPATSAPPRPPAACLLDTAAFATATGVTWVPDAATANDTRCVYDPATGPADGTRFVTVTLAPLDDTDALDELARLCDKGSRTPVTTIGFVCRFQERTVFAAAVHGQQVTTITASGAPTGTTVDTLATALAAQLDD